MIKTRAFSLIEVLIVVAIIGILGVVALPAYTSYSIRAKVVSMISAGEKFAKEMQKYYETKGVWPASPGDLGYAYVTTNPLTTNPSNCMNSSSSAMWRSPYIEVVCINRHTTGGRLDILASSSLLGLPTGSPNYITISQKWAVINGVMAYGCFMGNGTQGYIAYVPATCASSSVPF